MIPSQCSGCGRKLSAPDHLLGKSVKCPQCGNAIVIQPIGSGGTPPAQLSGFRETPPPPREESSRRSLLIGVVAAVGALALLGLVVYFGLSLFGGGTADWKEYASTEGGFTVVMPPNPALKDKPDPKIVTATKIREVGAEPSRSRNYTVHFYDLPDGPINDYLYLGWLKNHTLGGGGKLVRETDVSVKSAVEKDAPYNGKEIVVDLPDDQVLVRRVYLAEARVFWLTAQYPRSSSGMADAQKFFESFKITSVPKLQPRPAIVVATGPTEPPITTTPPPKDPPITKIDPKLPFPVKPEEQALVELINRFRLGEKAPPVLPEKKLFDGAKAEADALANKVPAKPSDYGYRNTFRLNLPARGPVSAQDLMSQMLAIKSFRNQLADEELTHIGVAVATSKDGITYYMILLCGGPR